MLIYLASCIPPPCIHHHGWRSLEAWACHSVANKKHIPKYFTFPVFFGGGRGTSCHRCAEVSDMRLSNSLHIVSHSDSRWQLHRLRAPMLSDGG